MGVKFSNKKISDRLKEIIKRSQNLKEPMQKIAVDMKNETRRNFDLQRSYDGEKWKKSKRAEEQGGQTLKNTGRLYNSFRASAGRTYARVGTNIIYARVLNQGAKKGEFGKVYFTVKQHTRKIKKYKKNGDLAKSKRRITVKPHLRRARIPWGDIPKYKYMGNSQEAKQRYIKIIKEYIFKK